MEEDFQVNGYAANDKTSDPKEHNGDVEDATNVAGAIETRTIVSLEGQFKGEPGEPLVNKVETTKAEDGLVETTEIRLKIASGCGCVLHTAAEACVSCLSCRRIGRDPLILCGNCAKNPDNACFVCNSVCCWRCRRERRIDGEVRLVCLACVKTTLRIKLIKQIIKWLLIGSAIYYVIML